MNYKLNTLISYRSLLAAMLVVWLTACGQTGPLYLPDQPAPIHVPETPEQAPENEQENLQPEAAE